MRAKYSPTIAARYVDNMWWMKNGGGYGLLPNGDDMSEIYFDFDHEGYDLFGYDKYGHDRAGYTVRHYEGDEELHRETAEAWSAGACRIKPVHEYWSAITSISTIIASKFPDLPLVHPQQEPPAENHVAIRRLKDGGYSIKLMLDIVDGHERSLEFRLDDGTGGSSPTDDSWTVCSIIDCGGETRKQAVCFLESRKHIKCFCEEIVEAFEPDRRLYDVCIWEDEDGRAMLKAFPRSERVSVDLLGSVYASSGTQAILGFAARHAPGGAISKMALRGVAEIGSAMEVDRPSSSEANRDDGVNLNRIKSTSSYS